MQKESNHIVGSQSRSVLMALSQIFSQLFNRNESHSRANNKTNRFERSSRTNGYAKYLCLNRFLQVHVFSLRLRMKHTRR